MDPAINLLQEMSEVARAVKDNELATPQQDPSSPFMSPTSTATSLYIVNSNQQPMTSDDRVKKFAIRSQDADHRRRFERFLNDCGVKRQSLNLTHTTEELNNIVHNLLSNDEDEDNRFSDEEERIDVPNEEHSDFDVFYKNYGDVQTDLENIDVVGNDDSEFTYVKYDYTIDTSQIPINKPPFLPLNLQDSFIYWEHDTKDNFQINEVPIEFTDEPQWTVKRQPAFKFADCLDMEFDGLVRLEYEYGKKYKNNLSCFSNQYQILFTASNSEIFGYKIEAGNKPCKTPIIKFDTKPSVINERDRLASTWPYFPFTINFMKIDFFLNKEILAVTCDDGRVMIWFVELLMRQVPKFELLSQQRIFINGIYGIRIHPDFQLRVECSAWSVDFYNKYNMIVVSDNSQKISLFYLEETEAKFYTVTSHQLLHNIPDVSFIKNDNSEVHLGNCWKIQISCASIRCELVIFEFIMYKIYGPFLNQSVTNGPITIDIEEDGFENTEDERVVFESPMVISRTLLNEDVWTVNHIDGSFFKKVNSLKSMIGDRFIDEDQHIYEMMRLNEKLDVESDPCLSSDLGLSAKFQFFSVPTEMLHGTTHTSLMTKNFNTLTDRYRRIRKMFDSYYLSKQRSKLKNHKSINGKLYWEPIVKTSQNNQFLCVTSSSKLGLFNTERLLCVSSTSSSVFDFNLSFGEEASYSNRLSLSCIIPELSCIVIGSQIGLVSIFRLCTYRGCFGFRQEYVFPNASRLALGDRGYRTITGLCVRKIGGNELVSRFVIYITYIDGLVLCYEVSEKDTGLEIIDL